MKEKRTLTIALACSQFGLTTIGTYSSISRGSKANAKLLGEVALVGTQITDLFSNYEVFVQTPICEQKIQTSVFVLLQFSNRQLSEKQISLGECPQILFMIMIGIIIGTIPDGKSNIQ